MRVGKKILTVLMILCLALSMSVPILAAEEGAKSEEETSAVSDDPRDSILQLWMAYEDDGANIVYYQGGTCFLINDEYVLTNKHLYSLDNQISAGVTVRNQIMEDFGLTVLNDNDPHLKLFLLVNKDMAVQATPHTSVQSDDMDFAAVKLSEKIYDRTPISLGDSGTITTKEKVYAMGYPVDSISTKDYNTKEDVSTVDGIISKITVTGNVDIIEHTAPLNFGNSGGPLVNERNEVIGINTFMDGKKNYTIQINPIKKALDTFGIPYSAGTTIPDDNKPEPVDGKIVEPEDNSALINELKTELENVKKIDRKVYTEESVKQLDDSIGKAEAVFNNAEASAAEIQGSIDDLKASAINLEEEAGLNLFLIGGIILAVFLVIILIVVLIIVNSSKKKKANEAKQRAEQVQSASVTSTTAKPASETAARPQDYSRPAAPPEGAGETTLLNAGAGETTLLSATGNPAYLIRKKNGEKIVINAQNFAIGKERLKVNYCISDNTSVSRCHVIITKKGSDYYITDQGTTNFTFLNDKQLSPKQETLLSDKSVLKLSDEEFEFYLS